MISYGPRDFVQTKENEILLEKLKYTNAPTDCLAAYNVIVESAGSSMLL